MKLAVAQIFRQRGKLKPLRVAVDKATGCFHQRGFGMPLVRRTTAFASPEPGGFGIRGSREIDDVLWQWPPRGTGGTAENPGSLYAVNG